MPRVVFEIDNLDLLQAVLPFRSDGVIRKQIDTFNFHGGPVGDKVLPVFLGRIGYGSGDDAKIPGALVGANVEEIATMIDVIFVISLARRDYFPAGVRIVGRNVAKFSRGLAECAQKDYGFVAR